MGKFKVSLLLVLSRIGSHCSMGLAWLLIVVVVVVVAVVVVVVVAVVVVVVVRSSSRFDRASSKVPIEVWQGEHQLCEANTLDKRIAPSPGVKL